MVDGGVHRHDFVAQALVSGLVEAQLATGVPAFSVSLMPHNLQPTAEPRDVFAAHFVKKGREAAAAVIGVLDLAV